MECFFFMEKYVLMGCDAASLHNMILAFRGNVKSSSSEVEMYDDPFGRFEH